MFTNVSYEQGATVMKPNTDCQQATRAGLYNNKLELACMQYTVQSTQNIMEKKCQRLSGQ